MTRILPLLLLVACGDVDIDVGTTSPAPAREEPKGLGDTIADDGLPAWAKYAGNDHPIVRKWKAGRLLFEACFPDGKHAQCKEMNLGDLDWEITHVGACLGCAGHYDPRDTLACEAFCQIKELKYGRASPGGCICEGREYRWAREHCQGAVCGEYGFEWIRTSRGTGYWTLPPRVPGD